MLKARTKRSHRNSLDRHGQEIGVLNFVNTGSDEYGDPIWKVDTDNSSLGGSYGGSLGISYGGTLGGSYAGQTTSADTITARVSRERVPNHNRNPSGEEIQSDVRVYVKDSAPVEDVEEAERPTEFVVGDNQYKVIRADDQDGGIIRCDCLRK